jgi:hypothetical protein
MARMNSNDHADTSPDLIDAGDYLCGITGAMYGETKNGKRYLELTVITVDGQVMTDRVYGTDDKGKGPWIQRVIAKLAKESAPSFTPVPDVPAQPHEDMDWESEDDVQAALLGGVVWLTIEVEAGGEKPTGGFYSDKNKGAWGLVTAAAAEDKDRFRKSGPWSRAAGRVRDMRATAIARWKADLLKSKGMTAAAPVTVAAKTAPADDGFIDDAIPF